MLTARMMPPQAAEEHFTEDDAQQKRVGPCVKTFAEQLLFELDKHLTFISIAV